MKRVSFEEIKQCAPELLIDNDGVCCLVANDLFTEYFNPHKCDISIPVWVQEMCKNCVDCVARTFDASESKKILKDIF